MNEHRCLDEVLDEMFYDRLTGTKFSSNIYPTNVQHEDQMLDEMLDTFDLSLNLDQIWPKFGLKGAFSVKIFKI